MITDILSQNYRPLNALAVLTNTAIGRGELATYRFGIDPFPAQPTEGNSLPPNSAGQWLGSGRRESARAPHAPRLCPRAGGNDDGLGRLHARAGTERADGDERQPDRQRRAAAGPRLRPRLRAARCAQRREREDVARGVPDRPCSPSSSSGASRARRSARTTRWPAPTRMAAHGRLASGTGTPQDALDPLGPGEWGPTGQDERHRLVATGIFDLPYGIQLSPVFQVASARPYTLTAGSDLNADGNNNDRWIDPATGQQVSINSARGDWTVVARPARDEVLRAGRRPADRRVCRSLQRLQQRQLRRKLHRQRPKRAVPVSRRAALIPGIGYPRTLQLGARFLF